MKSSSNLAARVIPVLLVRDGHLVKGTKFANYRRAGNPLQAAKIHSMRGVDELLYLDLTCDSPDLRAIGKLTDCMFMPVAVGGGIQSADDAVAVLRAGADKVVVKADRLRLISDIAHRVGCQAVSATLDYYRNDADVAVNAVCAVAAGAGEIILQNIDNSGSMNGYDNITVVIVSDAVSVPVIASGGCGTPFHMVDAVRAGASGAAAANMFLYTDATPAKCAQALLTGGVRARVPA